MQELRRAGRIERTGSLEAARWILSPVPKGYTKTPPQQTLSKKLSKACQ